MPLKRKSWGRPLQGKGNRWQVLGPPTKESVRRKNPKGPRNLRATYKAAEKADRRARVKESGDALLRGEARIRPQEGTFQQRKTEKKERR